MRNITFFAFAFVAFIFFSCKKTGDAVPGNNELTQAEISAIKAAGFQATGATKVDGSYLIEGDILLTADELRSLSTNNGPELIVANEEQYRTTKLVTSLPRTITVRYSGTRSSISTALTNAISRYNARGLRVTFQKVSSGGNIVISDVSGVSYIASAGFPSGGNPYSSIRFNTAYAGWTSNTLTSVIAHEIGHCIGFRHTDYMNRQYSCGGSYYNEGSAGIGAIHIPGTPTGPDPNSWMLACIGNGINRPFNSNDVTALNYVY